ncbi:transposase [Nonomuraea sp. JJY05]|uniref:transposase n=1 Tax=Nonomuraea sp. JJY05 TaxID=3350255 RepID=UPI00373E26CE
MWAGSRVVAHCRGLECAGWVPVTRRICVNARAYWLRARCAWRLLPHDLPPWQTVYHYWPQWRQDAVWERMLTGLRECDRVRTEGQFRRVVRTV